MKLLILISWFFLEVSCIAAQNVSNVENNSMNVTGIPVFVEGTHEVVFRGTTDVYKHYFSGIFAVKKEKTKKFRVVLMSEVGMTLLDLSFDPKGFYLNYCIEPLNRKRLLKLLYHDFLLLVNMPKPEELELLKRKGKKDQFIIYKKSNSRDFYCFETGLMVKIVSKEFLNRTHIQFKEVKTAVANNIRIQHRPFKLKIELTRI